MTKAVLTREKILCDFKEKMQSSLKAVIGFLIGLTCILVLLIVATSELYGAGLVFYLVVLFDAMIAFYVYICSAVLISNYKDYQNIKQGHFYVVTDELIGKQEPESYSGVRFLNTFAKSAELNFRSYGSFTITSHHTSDNPDPYVVSDVDNYFTSSVGDTFLLVITRKSQVLLVYNTKLFEYHG